MLNYYNRLYGVIVKYKKIIFIFLLAIILRFLFLDSIPYRVDGDSSAFAVNSLQVIEDGFPFAGTGWMGHANGYFYFIGFFIKLFSNQLIGIRALSAIGGLLGVIVTYLFVKKIINDQVAFWSALFLATSPFHLVFSRTGTEVVWMSFFVPITLLFFLSKQYLAVFISGILAGLAQYFYPGSRIIPVLVFLLLCMNFLHRKISWKEALSRLILWITGFCIVYLPMLIYFVKHPADYLIRVNMVSIFQPGWLPAMQSSGKLLEYVFNCFFVFFLPISGTPFWFYRTPYLDLIAIIFFAIGLLVGFRQIHKWEFQLLYVYLLLVIVLGGVFTINSPMPSRYIIAFPAVAGFAGYGIQTTLKIFAGKYQGALTASMIIAFISVSIFSYITHEQVDTWKYDTNTQIASYAGRYLRENSQQHKIYFLGNGNMYYEAVVTLPFLTKKEGVDIPLGTDISSMIFPQKSIFIVLPDREKDLRTLKLRYGSGKYKEFRNPENQLLFYLFEIS